MTLVRISLYTLIKHLRILKNFDLINIVYFCCWYLFVYFQQLHLDNFRGASKKYQLLLSIFVLVGWLTGFVYLIYYGFKVTWWAPVILFLIAPFSLSIKGLVKGEAAVAIISLLGFIAWPIFAYLMFKTIPIL